MKVELISIGTELLLGDIVDTNSAYLAQRLTEIGFDINYINTVGDNKKRMVKVISRALARADIVLTTGGLGPTTDDLTRKAVAESTGHPLEQREDLVEWINEFFAQHRSDITENNLRQTYLPSGARALMNDQGTAPGILLSTDDYIVISLPGVPREMKDIFKEKVIPFLGQLTGEVIFSRTLKFFGIGESTLETKVRDIIENQTNPTLALLAGKGEVKIRLTAKAETRKKCEKLIQKEEKKLNQCVGEYIYGINDDTLPKVVGKELSEQDLSLALAESCTGGLVGNLVTSRPGSSAYFKGGIVAYSNQVKKEELGVNEETLVEYGAVSKQTAEEMARGIKEKLAADFGVAVTGIAGPGGGTEEKPVGLVYIGLAGKKGTEVYQLDLSYNRQLNKLMTAKYALFYLYKQLVE